MDETLVSDSPFASVVSRLRAVGCVFAEQEATLILDAAERAADPRGDVEAIIDDLVTRRGAGEPLEHVVGWSEFCGLRIAVGPGVFVPRRRTEFLVERAVEVGRDAAVVVDLCCGAAPLAAAIAVRLPRAQIHAADIDPAHTAHARRNLALFASRAHVYEGDLYAALPQALRGRVDLLVANAPYVPTAAIATLPVEAREHEPVGCLDGGVDGLAVVRRIAADAGGWLAPGGYVLIETSAHQARHTRAAFSTAGLDAWIADCEELEATVVIGRRLRG